MSNFKNVISNYNFHDSIIEEIRLFQSEELDNCCEVKIIYYNWEGNRTDTKEWKKLSLTLKFGLLRYFEFDTPNIDSDTFTIFQVEYDDNIEKYLSIENKRAERYSGYKSKLFSEDSDYLSIKFIVAGIKDEFEDKLGKILIIGNKVEMKIE